MKRKRKKIQMIPDAKEVGKREEEHADVVGEREEEDPEKVDIVYNSIPAHRSDGTQPIRSDPASTESTKSEIIAHDNDVAAKSSLTDAKHPTTIDSLLPENEPTDTTDCGQDTPNGAEQATRPIPTTIWALFQRKMRADVEGMISAHTRYRRKNA
ncbi:hypothetical protein DBV15_08009 [Temnothorax longispinosus]|uniref:Uncharacterized protein n=1 Tax=Temnothorax longispinosus TaxID=300112 RepID=A0A4S2L0H6_9HYME|nr:hypothetical protein DBV15_08009 [Temnothorax longispinosus]